MGAAALAAVLGAFILQLSISKTRVFVADASACELTKNPEALIAAIRLVGRCDAIPGLDMSCAPLLFSANQGSWLNSHPSAQQRVAAIESYFKLESMYSQPCFTMPILAITESEGVLSQLAAPQWVASAWTMIPVLALAAYFASTTQWLPADRNEVAKYRDAIQASLEYVARISGSDGTESIEKLIDQQEDTYGIKLDRDRLIAIAKAHPVGVNNSGFISKAAPDYYAPSGEIQSVMFAVARQNRVALTSAISDAAYQCAYELSRNSTGEIFGKHWAKAYSGVGNLPGFAEGKFPNDHDIEQSLIKEAGGNYITPPEMEGTAASTDFFAGYWDRNYAASSVRNRCVFEKAFAALKDKIAITADTPKPVAMEPPAYTRSETGNYLIDLNTEEGRKLEESFQPTPREQELMAKLNAASWNNGTAGTAQFWIPAAFIMMLWYLIKGLLSLVRGATRRPMPSLS